MDRDRATAWQDYQNQRFGRATNVTPAEVQPKTIAEAEVKATEVKPVDPLAESTPSKELQTHAEARDTTAEVASKIKQTKVRKVPETEEQRKARMAKVRAARKQKAKPAEAAPSEAPYSGPMQAPWLTNEEIQKTAKSLGLPEEEVRKATTMDGTTISSSA